jgi:hypothetical protein
MPTAMKADRNNIYFGMYSGKIILYDLNKKKFHGVS